MTLEYRLVKFKQQDKLIKGKLKTSEGKYIKFRTLGVPYGIEHCHLWYPLSNMKEQDRLLDDGYLKFDSLGYVHIDKLPSPIVRDGSSFIVGCLEAAFN